MIGGEKVKLRNVWLFVLAAVFFVAVAAPHMTAQSLVSGDVTGTITDPSGAVVPNVPVTLKNQDTGRTLTATTNGTGFYRFALLPPGNYVVVVNQQGFQSVQRPVTVAVGQASTTNITLSVGASSQTVEVTAEVPVVNAENPNISTSYGTQQIALMPNPGGDMTYIAQTAPGVQMNTSAGYGNFSSFGLPATSNVFTINGENNMDPYFNINNSGATNLTLGTNEIQEATVVSNPYSGQYGQQAGAQITYVTRSGTNQFHGNATYWWNGRILNANDWFANNTGTPRPFANNNQWAASLGGPIRKDSTFFFINTEGLRYVLPTVQNTYIPSPQFQTFILGNLAATNPGSLPAYTTLFNMYNAAAARNNTHPLAPTDASDTNPGCGDFDGATLLGAGVPCAYNFVATPGQLSTEWILSGRLDQNIGSNDKAFVRFRMDRGNQATQTDPINAAYNATSSQPAYDGQLQETHVFGSGATNQFIAAGSYYRAIFAQNEQAVQGTGLPFGFYFPGAQFTDFGFAYRYPQGRNVTQYQLIDDFTKVAGNHTFKFGANFRRYDITDFNLGLYNNPRLYFTSTTDFANGIASQYRIRFPQRASEPVALWGLGLYAQDEWRVMNNLKLTLALRGEHNSNPVCQTDCISLLTGGWNDVSHSVDTPYNQTVRAGLHQAYPATDKINWSPRVGFTWSPGGRSTVFSGGFGIFYDALPASLVESFFFNFPNVNEFRVRKQAWGDPAAAATTAAASNAALLSGFANGLTYAQISALSPAFAAPSFYNAAGTLHTPRFQEWNLQFQQGLGAKSSITLNYVGNHGIHIPINNYGVNAFGFTDLPADAPDIRFGTVQEYHTGAVSNYNGLTASFQRKFSQGLTVQANYTWSHALDEISNGGVNPYGTESLLGQINPLNLRANNYGNSDYDMRHYASVNLVWTTPFKFNNGFLKQTLGGWTFSGNLFTHSGLPYTVLDGISAIGNYGGITPPAQPLFGQAGPAYAPGQLDCVNPNHPCLNLAGFVDSTDPAFAGYSVFPTQRRNQYRGPKFFNADFRAEKAFKLTERLNLAVGANFFNVFNHPNFNIPDFGQPYIGDSTVNTIQDTVSVPTSPYGSFVGAAASPRIIQLQGKITF